MTLLALSQPVQAKTFDKIIEDRLVCVDATTKFEKKYEIQEHLLSTISNVESGKMDKQSGRRLAWPWTINAQGKGMHFKTKAAAIAKIKELQAAGVKSIDVGCMQVNILIHKKAFANLEDALDPYKNVEYGAKFLQKLHARTNNDWMKAATNYHSKKPSKAKRYNRKLVASMEDVKVSLSSDIFDGIIERKKPSFTEKVAEKLTLKF